MAQQPNVIDPRQRQANRHEFMRRVLIVVGIVTAVVVLLLFAWAGSQVFLLAFAAVLLAVLLRGLSDWISNHTPLGSNWALAIVVVGLVAAWALLAWLLGTRIVGEVDQLAQTISTSLQQVQQYLSDFGWLQQAIERLPNPQQVLSQQGNIFGRITGVFSTVFGALANLVIVLSLGLYLAASPSLYERGVLYLVPQTRRRRMREILGALGYNLRWWLLGQLTSMTIVGVLVGVGLWLLGVPLALTLGLLAGLLEYIPNIGPTLAAIPAVLVALTQGPQQAVWALGLYLAVQFAESYLITPLVFKRAVSLPPALTLVSLVLAGVLFGFLGVLIAVPLTVVIMTLIKMLYVEDILDDQSIEVEGEAPEHTAQTYV